MDNSMYELKVFEKTDHFNGRNWFVVTELESDEELLDVDTKLQAEHGMFRIIKNNPGLYFTNQDVVEGFAYWLKRCNGGSDKFGACEVCDKQVDSTYLLTEMVRYWNPLQKTESLTFSGCRPQLFGHRECLSLLTNERFAEVCRG